METQRLSILGCAPLHHKPHARLVKEDYGITLGHRAKPNRRDGHCNHAFQAAPFAGIRHITRVVLWSRADTKSIICKIKVLLYAAAEGLDETLAMKVLLHDFTAIQKGQQDAFSLLKVLYLAGQEIKTSSFYILLINSVV